MHCRMKGRGSLLSLHQLASPPPISTLSTLASSEKLVVEDPSTESYLLALVSGFAASRANVSRSSSCQWTIGLDLCDCTIIRCPLSTARPDFAQRLSCFVCMGSFGCMRLSVFQRLFSSSRLPEAPHLTLRATVWHFLASKSITFHRSRANGLFPCQKVHCTQYEKPMSADSRIIL